MHTSMSLQVLEKFAIFGNVQPQLQQPIFRAGQGQKPDVRQLLFAAGWKVEDVGYHETMN